MVPRAPMRKRSELFQSQLRLAFCRVLESPPLTRICVTVSVGMSECWTDQVFTKIGCCSTPLGIYAAKGGAEAIRWEEVDFDWDERMVGLSSLYNGGNLASKVVDRLRVVMSQFIVMS